MVNLRILMMPKFENYSSTFVATSWILSNFQPTTSPVPTSAALLITSGTCYWTSVMKHSHYLPPSELLFLHLNITHNVPHSRSIHFYHYLYTFYVAFLFCAIPCRSCQYELLNFLSSTVYFVAVKRHFHEVNRIYTLYRYLSDLQRDISGQDKELLSKTPVSRVIYSFLPVTNNVWNPGRSYPHAKLKVI